MEESGLLDKIVQKHKCGRIAMAIKRGHYCCVSPGEMFHEKNVSGFQKSYPQWQTLNAWTGRGWH